MRIKLKSIMAGPDGVFDVGALLDVPKERAKSLVDGGYAVYHPKDEPVVVLPSTEPAAGDEHGGLTAEPAGRKRRGG